MHWLPWRPRWRGSRPRGEDLGWFDPVIDLSDIWALVLVILGLILLVFFVLPALIFVLEVLLFLVLAALAVAVRSLFGRPWTVEALSEGPGTMSKRWGVVGLGRSRRVVAYVADALERGAAVIEPDDGVGLEPR